MITEEELREMQLQSQGMPGIAQEPPEARREAWNRSLPGASRSNASADSWSPELREKSVSVV